MSERLGHMAWGPRGAVFLGEDLIHTRDYSDETVRIIDEEIAHLLDAQVASAHALEAHRPLLDAVAEALIQHETVSGDDIAGIAAGVDGTPARPPIAAVVRRA